MKRANLLLWLCLPGCGVDPGPPPVAPPAPAPALPSGEIARSRPASEPGGLQPVGLGALRFEPDFVDGEPGVYRARARRAFVRVSGRGLDLDPGGLRLRFLGAAASTAALEGEDELPGVSNYVFGDPGQWRTGVKGFGRVRCRGVYPQIDAVYRGTASEIEYDLVLHPGADPATVRLGIEGAQRIEIDRRGDLVLHTPEGPVRHRRPVVYQDPEGPGGRRRAVAARYVRRGPGEVGIRLAAYDRRRPVIVDPAIEFFQYSGANGADSALAVAVDRGPSGDAYVAGFATLILGRPSRAVVWKYGPHGEPIWTTYFGGAGTGGTIARGVAFHNGRVFIAGVTTEPKLATTGGAYQFQCPAKLGQMTCNGNRGFVARLDDAKMGMVTAASYLSGSDFDEAWAVATDDDGSVYVAGDAHSADLTTITKPNIPAYQKSCTATAATGRCDDAFLAKLEPTLGSAIFLTFLGGDGVDSARAVAVQADRSPWIGGSTTSARVVPNQALALGRQADLRGSQDAFAVRLSPSGGLITWATLLGGGGFEIVGGLAVDEKGLLHLAGTTNSADFPAPASLLKNGAWSPAVAALGKQDAFAVKLDPMAPYKLDNLGQKVLSDPLAAAILLGGSGDDLGNGVAVGEAGAVVVGTTDSTEMQDSPQAAPGGKGDAFLAQLDPLGQKRYFTYLGGQEIDRGSGVGVDAAGYFRVAGFTSSGDMGVKVSGGGIQSVYRGGGDGFLLSDHPPRRPVIFIHGVLGSILERFDPINGEWSEVWLGLLAHHDNLTLWPSDQPARSFWDPVRRMNNGPERMRVPDVFRLQPDVPGLREDFYEGLLQALRGAGFLEYQVQGPDLEAGRPRPHPERRTLKGCDLTQAKGVKGDVNDPRNPMLFPLAYDWRLDNNAHVAELREYIECIRTFYPGTKVNVVAHSMGNLVTRRYILDYSVGTMSGRDESYIDSYVTIGAPVLGVPKFFFVALTGDTGISAVAVRPSVFRYLIGSMAGPAQLLAGERYFKLTEAINSPKEWPPPLIEEGWDLNGKDGDHEVYDYARAAEAMNLVQKANKTEPGVPLPGDLTDRFHSRDYPKGDQDDWSVDNTAIHYYHVIGLASSPLAIGQVSATVKPRCVDYPGQDFSGSDNCQKVANDQYAAKRLVPGDNTVAHLSALRRDPANIAKLDYNKKGAKILVVQGSPKEVDHATGICSHPQTVAAVLGVANGNPLPASFPGPPPPPSLPIFDLVLRGVDVPVVADTKGQSTAPKVLPGPDGGVPFDTAVTGTVPNVFQFHQGPGVEGVAAPTAMDDYTVTFTATEPTVAITIDVGDGRSAKRVIRYLDRKLGVNMKARLTLRADERVEPLRIDLRGDGSFTGVVLPDVDVSGPGADDLEGPRLALSAAPGPGGEAVVTVSAQDSSGIARTFVSVDGVAYSRYQGPLTLDPKKVPVLFAFADDKVGNRSGRYRLPLVVGPAPDGGVADLAMAPLDLAKSPLDQASAPSDQGNSPVDQAALPTDQAAGIADGAEAVDRANLEDGPSLDLGPGGELGALADGATEDGSLPREGGVAADSAAGVDRGADDLGAGSLDAMAPPPERSGGGCACTVARRAPASGSPGITALVLLVGALAARRRRWGRRSGSIIPLRPGGR